MLQGERGGCESDVKCGAQLTKLFTEEHSGILEFQHGGQCELVGGSQAIQWRMEEKMGGECGLSGRVVLKRNFCRDTT